MCSRFPTLVHTVIHTSVVLPALRQLHTNFGDFNSGVFHVVEITTDESNPNIELLTQQTFFFSPYNLARANKMPIMAMSIASDWSHLVLDSSRIPTGVKKQ